jgi:hypothetical protein
MSVMPKAVARRVFVRVAPSGAWIISDEYERRGGRFRSRECALQFIRREFGTKARLVFVPPMLKQAA